MKKNIFDLHIKNIFKTSVFILLITDVSLAQTDKDLPNFIPASPTASTFQNYIDYPVDLYNGLPNVNIPLYNLKVGNYNLPISLSYNAGGVKVQENESLVGLKWSLNAGGLISRNIVGHPDESEKVGKYGGWFDSANVVEEVIEVPTDLQLLEYTTKGCYDFQPDVFYLNLPTGGTKFVFDKNQIPVQLTANSNFKITPASLTLQSGWTVYDEIGNEYFLNPSESTKSDSSCKSSSPEICPAPIISATSWNLDYIIPAGTTSKISFKYKNYTYTENLVTSDTFCPSMGAPLDINKKCETLFTYNLSIPEEITSGDYKISFISSQQTNKHPKIDEIKIFYKNVMVKNYVFEYSTDKLLLKKIKEISTDTTNNINQYSFDYYNEAFRIDKNSYAVDYFGYYNGQTANQSLIPNKTGIFEYVEPTWEEVCDASGDCFLNSSVYFNLIKSTIGKKSNREINPAVLSNLSLQKITYPTGGNQMFYYEPNSFDNKEDYIDKSAQYLTLATSNSTNLPSNFSDNFIVADNNTPVSIYSVKFQNFDTIFPPNHTSTAKVEFINTSNNQVVYTFTHAMRNQNPLPIITLNAGTYKLKFYYATHFNIINVRLGYSNSLNIGRNRLVGGQRIQKIEMNEPATNSIMKTEYVYTQFDNNLLSSGEFPKELYNLNSFIRKIRTPNFYVDAFISTSNKPMQNSRNSLVGYTDVQLIKTNTINNAKIVSKYKYSYEPDFFKGKIVFGTPHTSMDHKRGLLLWEKHYSDNTTLIKEINNNYIFNDNRQTIRGMATTIESDNQGITQGGIYPNTVRNYNGDLTFKYEFYIYNSNWVYKNSETTTEYHPSGNIIKNTNYVYSNPNHFQLTSQNTLDSNNQTLETKYYYPHDLPSEPYVADLISKNMIAVPLKTESYKNTTKLSERLSEYTKTIDNLLLPKFIYTNKGAAAIAKTTDKKITYDQYDDKGNILQYTPESGMPVSIIWGYNQTQPIAKIENAPYANASSYVANLQSLSNTGTEANLITALNSLRTNLPNAMITTYTYQALIGVSTITDPKGDTIYYTYDGFGRLQYVKDKNSNLLSENQYHYKN
ncbi:MAG: hypothetical protein V4572_11665 [Bacteroidota bacterium]